MRGGDGAQCPASWGGGGGVNREPQGRHLVDKLGYFPPLDHHHYDSTLGKHKPQGKKKKQYMRRAELIGWEAAGS